MLQLGHTAPVDFVPLQASTRLGVDVISAAQVAPVTDTLAINDVADSRKPVLTGEGEAAMRSACAQPFVVNWSRSHVGVFEQSVQLSVFKQVVRTSQSTMNASCGNHDSGVECDAAQQDSEADCGDRVAPTPLRLSLLRYGFASAR